MNTEVIENYTSKITVDAESSRKGIRRVIEACVVIEAIAREAGDAFRANDVAKLFQKLGEVISTSKTIRQECRLAEQDDLDIINACFDMEQLVKKEKQ